MKRHLFIYRAVAVVVIPAAVWLVAAPATTVEAQQSTATPRTPDGKPDLTGFWASGDVAGEEVNDPGNVVHLNMARPCHPGQACGPGVNAERDAGVRMRQDTNKPFYKPEYWERVQYLDMNGNDLDMGGRCYPRGVPRMGIAQKIIQTPREVILLYQDKNTFRVVPIDGRPHHPVRSKDIGHLGDSVGEWDGDTLVIDVVGLTDDKWLDSPGYLHSTSIRVVEKYRREGNKLTWQATVYDPEVLEEPWVMDPTTVTLNPDPTALLPESYACEERDWQHMASRERG